MFLNYYNYKTHYFRCQHCGWYGTGAQASKGETFEAGFELDCPKCYERFPGLISFPTNEEAAEHEAAGHNDDD